ncbi:MAG: energy-coupling factor transporter transmembrane component T family protein [Thermoleophilia bacterium]
MRLSGVVIGQYFPGESIFHRVDPRTKIITSFAFVLVLFLVRGFFPLGLMGAGLLAAIIAARIPASWIFRTARPVFWLALITLCFQIFMQGGEELTRLGPLPVYRDGISDGGFLAARLVLLVLSGTLLTFTTPPVLLTDALGRLLAPLTRIRVPAYELALMATIAMRFIPTLLMETDRIIKAQQARGADSSRGGPIRRGRGLMPVLIPLFMISFRHADELAQAMESRCWRGGAGRTVRRRLRFGRLDALLGLMVAAVLTAALSWTMI